MRIAGKLICLVAVGALVAISLFAGIRQSPSNKSLIWVDIADLVSIEPPFEVMEIGPHGERGLRLSAEAGRGWKNEGGGSATYECHVAEKGTYTIWAYCLWHDACTNAVYVQMDDSGKGILGNDPVYGRWHWVRGFEMPLEAGPHRLRLSNHSPNIGIMKLFLTNDPLASPLGVEVAMVSVLFSDNFNGCDQGNFGQWAPARGRWWVEHPAYRQDAEDNVLIGTSSEMALLVLPDMGWRDYRLSVSVLPKPKSEDAAIGLRFGVQADEGFGEIRLSRLNHTKALLKCLVADRSGERVVSEHQVPWTPGAWHNVACELYRGEVIIVLDGKTEVAAGPTSIARGGIGLALYGPIEADFDDVAVHSIAPSVRQ